MTILLGRRVDRTPITCCVCGRMAGSFGTTPDVKQPIAWLCQDPDCWGKGSKVYRMPQAKLNRYEEVAVASAGEKIIDPLLDAVLSAVYHHGVKLDDLTPEKYALASKTVTSGPEFRRALESFLKEYAASIKQQIAADDPPF